MPLQQVLIYYIDFAIICNQAYNRRMNDGPFERWFCWFFCINFFSLDRIKSCKSASLTRIDDTWCWHCYLCPKVRCVSVTLMCVYNGPVPWKSPVICSRSGAIKKLHLVNSPKWTHTCSCKLCQFRVDLHVLQYLQLILKTFHEIITVH